MTTTNIRKAKERADMARSAFEEAVREAHVAGKSLRVIASEAGLSFQRIHQIVHRR